MNVYIGGWLKAVVSVKRCIGSVLTQTVSVNDFTEFVNRRKENILTWEKPNSQPRVGKLTTVIFMQICACVAVAHFFLSTMSQSHL